MPIRTRLSALAAVAVLLITPACSYLRDAEPWTATVFYTNGLDGRLAVEPLVVEADANYGIIQVVNETSDAHGFAVRELAVFETVPAGITIPVTVDEAEDDTTYIFECQLHDNEYRGEIRVNYLSEEFRR